MSYIYVPNTGDHHTVNVGYGCRPKGISCGCENCSAVFFAQRQTGRKGVVGKICKKVLTKDKDGKNRFNGNIIENPNCYSNVHKTGRKHYFLSYATEIAFARHGKLIEAFEHITEHWMHEYTFLTKLPKLLFGKVQAVAKYFKDRKSVYIPDLLNISFATSIENNDYLYRINDLRKFSPFSKNLQVWYKPLINRIRKNVSYKGINCIRVSRERGPGRRDFKQEWFEDIKQVGEDQGVDVYHDSELHRKLVKR